MTSHFYALLIYSPQIQVLFTGHDKQLKGRTNWSPSFQLSQQSGGHSWPNRTTNHCRAMNWWHPYVSQLTLPIRQSLVLNVFFPDPLLQRTRSWRSASRPSGCSAGWPWSRRWRSSSVTWSFKLAAGVPGRIRGTNLETPKLHTDAATLTESDSLKLTKLYTMFLEKGIPVPSLGIVFLKSSTKLHVVDEVAGHQLLIGEGQDALHVGLSGLHGSGESGRSFGSSKPTGYPVKADHWHIRWPRSGCKSLTPWPHGQKMLLPIVISPTLRYWRDKPNKTHPLLPCWFL